MIKTIITSFLIGLFIGSIYYLILAGLPTIPSVETLRTPTTFEVTNNSYWQKLQLLIQSNKNVLIKWQGYGGEVFMGNEFMDSIKDAEKNGTHVVFEIIGASYSMHAVAVCAGDKLIFDDGGSLGFHAPFYRGKRGSKIYAEDKPTKIENGALLQQCVDKGILHQQDIESILVDHKLVVITYNKSTHKLETSLEDDQP